MPELDEIFAETVELRDGYITLTKNPSLGLHIDPLALNTPAL